MARPPDAARRAELVAAALEDLSEHGLTQFTLRGLATRLGTSARMLVHYFGTREQLLAAVLIEHRRRMVDVIAEASDAASTAWVAMTDPAQRGHFVVMYHLLTATLTGVSPDTAAAQHAVLAWVDHATDLVVAATGRDPASARVDATILASGLKGILLDRLVTGDHARCDAAAARMIDLVLS